MSASLCIMALGYLLYALARERWLLFAARLLMGIGAANVSVLRFYASGATSEAYRTVMMVLGPSPPDCVLHFPSISPTLQPSLPRSTAPRQSFLLFRASSARQHC